jgi:membrane associated rhomboid family serine protease
LSPLKPTVGASGAIFGVLGGLFILERRRHIATGGQIAGLIVLNLVITLAFSSSISVGGHIGGLIGGLVFGYVITDFGPKQLRDPRKELAVISALGVAAFVVAFAIAKPPGGF